MGAMMDRKLEEFDDRMLKEAGYKAPEKKPDMVWSPPHYARFTIQPLDFVMANGLSYAVGNVIKYVCRYPHKGRPLEDLEKAKSYIETLIAEEKRRQAGSVLSVEVSTPGREGQTPRATS